MTTIVISTDNEKLDIDFVHGFLKTSYWAKGIPRYLVEQSINNSLCFGVYKKNKQIGFARVITDYTTFAYLADVFFGSEHRGNGFGKKLIAEILGHEKLQDLRRWHLITSDAQNFYRDFQFVALENPDQHLEKRIMPAYQLNDKY